METQIRTKITITKIIIANSNVEFYVKESVDEILTMIKNTMGDNFITLTLLNYSDVVSDKLYIRAKSIIGIHEEEDFQK